MVQTKSMSVASSGSGDGDSGSGRPAFKRRRRVYGVRHFPPGCGPQARINVAGSGVSGVSAVGLENGANVVGDHDPVGVSETRIEGNKVPLLPVLVDLDSKPDELLVSSDDAGNPLGSESSISVVHGEVSATGIESRDLTTSLDLDDERNAGHPASMIGSHDVRISKSLGQLDVGEQRDEVKSKEDIQLVSPHYTNGETLESMGRSLSDNSESGHSAGMSEPAKVLQDEAIGLSMGSHDAVVFAPLKITSMVKYPPRRKMLGVRIFPPNCGRNAKPLRVEEEENVGALIEVRKNEAEEAKVVNVDGKAHMERLELKSVTVDREVKGSVEKSTRNPDEVVSCTGDVEMVDQGCELDRGIRSPHNDIVHNSNKQGESKRYSKEESDDRADTVKGSVEKATKSPDEVVSCPGDVEMVDQGCELDSGIRSLHNHLISEHIEKSKIVHNSNKQGDLKRHLREESDDRADTKVKESTEKETRSQDEVVSYNGDMEMVDQGCEHDRGIRSPLNQLKSELGEKSKVVHNSNRQGDLKRHLQVEPDVRVDTKVKGSIEKTTRSPDEVVYVEMVNQGCERDRGIRSPHNHLKSELREKCKVVHNSNRQGDLKRHLQEEPDVRVDMKVKGSIEETTRSPDEECEHDRDIRSPHIRLLSELGENPKVVHNSNTQGDLNGHLWKEPEARKAKVAAQRKITKLSASKKKSTKNNGGMSSHSSPSTKGTVASGSGKLLSDVSEKSNKKKEVIAQEQRKSASKEKDKSSTKIARPKSSLVEKTDESVNQDADLGELNDAENDDKSGGSRSIRRRTEFSVNVTPFGPGSSKGFASARKKVRETLRLFNFICRKLVHEAEARCKKGESHNKRVDFIAARELRIRGMSLNEGQYIVGAFPGVEVGDEFQFRMELNIIGLHRQTQGGIDFVKQGQDIIAVSVVASGGYDDNLDNSDILDYTGQGGNSAKDKEAEDQKLEKGNLGLKNSITTKNPVRVIRGDTKISESADGRSKVYVYDGLYNVVKYWQEPGPHGKLVFKFRMIRIPGQPELAWKQVKKSRKLKQREGICVNDISQGKELIPICAVNTVDDEKPPPFKYITQIMYPDCPSPPSGCNCRNGCSESGSCSCVAKNGGEIPFNNNGAIVEAKDLVYECGPSCRCPPSCYNRVSQQGIKIQLEIFKTDSRGWGVRSLNSISSGSFICEYVGELLEDSEAERRTNDEYLFDIGGCTDDTEENGSCEAVQDPNFTIDAAEFGNVGRFINHSCSPNLYAQNVLYDHGDQRIPHIMLFAAENIPPLRELTYHYNYQLDQVLDSQGNIKMKNCYCGSSECTGRMY
ncbi:Histone-lysine N-methyltransferase, H3 lysine-9 specific SUVH5 [Linum perenne]